MNVIFYTYTYGHLYFNHWNSTCIAWFYKIKLTHRGFWEYVVNAHGSWSLMKGIPLYALDKDFSEMKQYDWLQNGYFICRGLIYS